MALAHRQPRQKRLSRLLVNRFKQEFWISSLLHFVCFKYFHKTLQLHQVENGNFLLGMIWWRSCHNCGQMVDCRCIQGLSQNLCWKRRSWQCKYRLLHQMWVHGLNNCMWNGSFYYYASLFETVSLVPSLACWPMRIKRPLSCTGIQNWKLISKMVKKESQTISINWNEGEHL